MPGLTFIKTCLFRLLAVTLLAVSAGLFVLPESSPYSANKTFIKSPVPTADSFALATRGDDKEDIDEDGMMDAQMTTEFSSGLISWVQFGDGEKGKKQPIVKYKQRQTYILHRQMLI
jgi:hypothetical protein